MATMTTSANIEIDRTRDGRAAPSPVIVATRAGTDSGPVNVLAALAALVWIVLGGGAASTGTTDGPSRSRRSFVRGVRQV